MGIPLIFFIALGGVGFAFGRMGKISDWDSAQRGWDGPQAGWNKHMHGSEPLFFKVGAQPTLIINDTSGDVHIHVGDAGRVIVQPQGFNDFKNGVGGVHSDYDPKNDTMHIDVQDQPGSGSGFPFGNNNADLEITVPDTTTIQVQTVSGDIAVDGVDGNLTLNTVSGSVSAEHVGGQMVVTSTSGDVKVSDSLLKGQSTFKTTSGDISFDGSIDPQGSNQFVTSSGDVDLSLPSNSSFVLNTTTSSGDVSNDFNNTTIGASPHAQLTINTDSGSIKLQKTQ